MSTRATFNLLALSSLGYCYLTDSRWPALAALLFAAAAWFSPKTLER